MTINNFTHFALYNGYLYIYDTPDSSDYTLQLTGSKIQDEYTDDSEIPTVRPHLAWGLIWHVLSRIAELNGDKKSSDSYIGNVEYQKKEWKKVSTRKNTNLNAVPPYSLL